MTTHRPDDELAARRLAKATAAQPTTMEQSLQQADTLLMALIHLGDDQLLVSAEEVRTLARRADRLVVDCLLAERDRTAAR